MHERPQHAQRRASGTMPFDPKLDDRDMYFVTRKMPPGSRSHALTQNVGPLVVLLWQALLAPAHLV